MGENLQDPSAPTVLATDLTPRRGARARPARVRLVESFETSLVHAQGAWDEVTAHGTGAAG